MSRGWVEEIVTGNNPAFGINYSMYKKCVCIFHLYYSHLSDVVFCSVFFFPPVLL